MLELKKEMPLKLIGFLVRDGNINIQIPETIDFTFDYTIDGGMKTMLNKYKSVVKTIKPVIFVDYTEFKDFLDKVITPDTPQVIPQEIKEFVVQEEQKTDIGLHFKNYLEYIVNDNSAESMRNKLSKVDISNLNKIIKKL